MRPKHTISAWLYGRAETMEDTAVMKQTNQQRNKMMLGDLEQKLQSSTAKMLSYPQHTEQDSLGVGGYWKECFVLVSAFID